MGKQIRDEKHEKVRQAGWTRRVRIGSQPVSVVVK